MKIIVWIAIVCVLLTGCGAETFETLGDIAHVASTEPPLREILLAFPDSATVLTASGPDCLYTCENYTMSLQMLPAGDTRSTIVSLCGYKPEQLTVLESSTGQFKRYDWVWTAAGENADVICRAALIDDGNYHYSLCVSAVASDAGLLTEAWNALFASFTLGQVMT